jgi:hypothetical protein
MYVWHFANLKKGIFFKNIWFIPIKWFFFLKSNKKKKKFDNAPCKLYRMKSFSTLPENYLNFAMQVWWKLELENELCLKFMIAYKFSIVWWMLRFDRESGLRIQLSARGHFLPTGLLKSHNGNLIQPMANLCHDSFT